MLFDDAIDGGQAEAGAFAGFLGGEERLERWPRVVWVMPQPVSVTVKQTKLPGARLGIEDGSRPGRAFAGRCSGSGVRRAAWRRGH